MNILKKTKNIVLSKGCTDKKFEWLIGDIMFKFYCNHWKKNLITSRISQLGFI